MEYGDVPNNHLIISRDDFGECVWPEGIGQLIQAAYLSGNDDLAEKHILEMEKIEYDFGNGKMAYPYSWPVNMIIDTAGAGWGDDGERIDSLSIAATSWMYLGKSRISCFANAEMPEEETE